MTGSDDDADWRDDLEKFKHDGEGRDEYAEMFQNEVENRVLLKTLSISTRSPDGAGDCYRSIACLTMFDVWIGTVVWSLTELEKKGGQRQNLFADTQRKMLKLALELMNGNVNVVL